MDLINESESQFKLAWRAMVDNVEGRFIAEEDGVAASILNVPLFILNAVFFTKPVSGEALEQKLDVAKRLASGCASPWFLAAREDTLPANANEVLATHGIHPAMKLMGMVADELTPARPAPAELEMRTGADDEMIGALMDVNAHAYGFPLELGRASIRPGLFAKDTWCVAGYVDAKPVSVTMTMPVDGRLYVGWVATLPEAQRKGYAEAVMRRSLADAAAATGLRRTVLHASEAGRPVYLRMGYQDVASFSLFAHGMDH